MYIFILLNTIPCYYRVFGNKDTAENFGLALQFFGENENEKYRYKVFEKKPQFIDNKRFNGYELIYMNNILYDSIIGEFRKC